MILDENLKIANFFLETPGWLGLFQMPLNNWGGVNLNNGTNHHLRFLLAECRASLLDLRSYLFSRQCAMLLLLNKPWEVCTTLITNIFVLQLSHFEIIVEYNCYFHRLRKGVYLSFIIQSAS